MQVLPVKQVGSLLFKNQLTEELPHEQGSEKDSIKKSEVKSEFLVPNTPFLSQFVRGYLFSHIIKADAIPMNFSVEIHVPPPNC